MWDSKIIILTLCSARAHRKWCSHTSYSPGGIPRLWHKSPPWQFFLEHLGNTGLQLLVIHNFQHVPFYPIKQNQILNKWNTNMICLFCFVFNKSFSHSSAVPILGNKDLKYNQSNSVSRLFILWVRLEIQRGQLEGHDLQMRVGLVPVVLVWKKYRIVFLLENRNLPPTTISCNSNGHMHECVLYY